MSQRTRNLVFWGLVLAILASVPVAYWWFLERDHARTLNPAPIAPPKAPGVVELSVIDVEGAVEVRRVGGDWVLAKQGTALRAQDSIRTRDGAHAVLSGGDAYDVRLESGTDVSVEALTESLSKLLLGSGMATARVRGGQRAFEVRSSATNAVARTREGTFTISSNGKDTVAVGTREGAVELEGEGKVVIVRAGQVSVAHLGQAPTDPVSVPSSLFLKVQWPANHDLQRRSFIVKGKTDPGAHLEIAGQVTAVDATGGFSRTVTLKEGANELQVKAHAVGGDVQEDQRKLRVDTTPPKVDLDEDLWKRK